MEHHWKNVVTDSYCRGKEADYFWIRINRMALNVDKTECMLLGTVKRLNSALKDFSVGENEYIIKPVNTHKLLGLHIDNTQSWTTHVSHLCSKLQSRLYLFNKIKNHMPAFVRKQYFDGLVQPVIDYGCVIWGSGSHDLPLKVHKMVKMYARSMMDIRDKRLIPTIELFEILDRYLNKIFHWNSNVQYPRWKFTFISM